MLNLFLVVLWIQLIQFVQGDRNNWKRIDDNNEIYPWLVQIKIKVRPELNDKIAYGSLISHNAVITTQESVIVYTSIHNMRKLVVESYCPEPNVDITNDCFTSDVASIISETSSESSAKNQDPLSILILTNSFNDNYYVRPLSIANIDNIDKDNCFLATWPSHDPSEFSNRIDLHKTAHKATITFGSCLVSDLDKNVINALSREPYYDYLRFNYLYSDDYIPQIDGAPLICSLKNNSNQVALVGPIPGYFLYACNREKKDCRSIIYFIDLMSYSTNLMNKLNSQLKS
ncbi:uncharacterized protein [Chelonus insularis]|uniref:uncharacterized protein n=1 Tax=Chelonus insularis TaxID=460826 RepID=UPI00158AD207|nr:uncharacterized protein LOC118067587 [Chelonus insularis]